jgi:hypothetical protein
VPKRPIVAGFMSRSKFAVNPHVHGLPGIRHFPAVIAITGPASRNAVRRMSGMVTAVRELTSFGTLREIAELCGIDFALLLQNECVRLKSIALNATIAELQRS